MNERGSFGVGYCRPPKHSQFRKGASGNPRGRPKGALNLATVLARKLREKVVVEENGKRMTVTKIEAAIGQATNKAVAGDLRALQFLATLVRSVEEPGPPPEQTSGLDEYDQRVLVGILERWKPQGKENKNETDAG